MQVLVNLRFFWECLHLTVYSFFRKRDDSHPKFLDGRNLLSKRVANYLHFLKKWDRVHVEYIGFEDVAIWKGAILCPNHPSLLDALLLLQKIPHMDCVMSATPLKDPFMAGPARLANFIPNFPVLSMIKTCRRRLQRGANILLFPEGTRTTSGALNPLQEGCAFISVKADAPIRTFFIECDSSFFGKSFSYWKVIPETIHFRVTAGEVLKVLPGESTRDFTRRIDAYFREHLHRSGNAFRLKTSPSLPLAPLSSCS